MKRPFALLLFSFAAFFAFGQKKQTNYIMPYLEYGYNYTWGHFGSVAAVADFSIFKNFTAGAGIMLSTSNVYAAEVHLNYGIPLKNSSFYLENRYLGKWYVRDLGQEYTLSLSAGFLNYHWKFQFGLYGKFYGGLGENRHKGEKMLFEPLGIIYLGEGRVFRDNHPWNIGGRISNVDYFTIERFSMPLFTIFGDAEIGEKTRIFAEICAHPSGNFNIEAQFYGITGKVGIKYKW